MLALGAAAALVLASALPPPPTQPGFPSFDPRWERLLIERGGAQPSDAGVVARGRFVTEGGALRLVEPAAFGDSTWLTPTTVADGVVRARFVVGSRLDSSVLVRAAAGPDGEVDEGYAVSVERGVLRLYRYEHKVPRFLGAEDRIAPAAAPTTSSAAPSTASAVTKGSVLELVVTVTGPFISAAVYDGATLAPRAHVAVRDRRASSGRVGLRMSKYQDIDSGVSLLSVGGAGGELAAADVVDGAGAQRLVVLDQEALVSLAPELRAKVVHTDTQLGRAFMVTDHVGEERVRRAGVVPVEVRTQIPWKYEDATMLKLLGKPPNTTAGGLRIDESYKDAVLVEEILRAYAARFPHIARLEEIGRTLEGRAMWALVISRNVGVDEDEDAVLLDGAHHGGELMSIEFVLDAIQQLLERYKRDAAVTALVDKLEIWCVPLVNADGNMRYVHETRDYDRKNARDIDNNGKIDGWDGVDLYRNYPVRWGALGEVGSRSNPFHYRYRGPAAGSEPEMQAMMKLATRERFVSSIDFHTNATKILVPYTDPGMENPDANEAWVIAEEMAARLPMQVNGKKYEVARNLYPVDGTYQDWLRFNFGTVSLLVEGPTNNPLPYSRGRPGAVVGTRPTWQLLFDRTVSGPGIEGRVKDGAGNAIEAEVIVDEQRPRGAEVWTSRPSDGRFHRLVPGPGRYTLRVRAAGFAEAVRRVDVGAGNVKVDVVLERKAATARN